MNGLKWALGAIAAVIAILLALPALLPLESYRAELERAASQRLDGPVGVERLEASFFPTPSLIATGVSVGNSDGLEIERVAIRPRLTSLLRERTAISAVEVSGVTATSAALRHLLLLAGARKDENGAMQVEKLVLEDVRIETKSGELGPIRAAVVFSSSGEPVRAELRTADDGLRAELVPEGRNYAVKVRAEDWTLPWKPALAFKRLDMKGRAANGELRFDDVSAEGYGGTATGTLRFRWDDGLLLAGQLQLERLALADLLAAFGAKSRVTGRLDARPSFRAHAKDAATLRGSLHLEGPFTVHEAVLRGVDLQAAASLVKPGERSKDTRFDELSGKFVWDRGAYRFARLKASSGALAARGELAVSRSKVLNGRLYAQLEGGGGATEVPLDVGGTIAEPRLAPTGATIAGAAVGTAVLGPGIGTTVGAKLGAMTEKALDAAD